MSGRQADIYLDYSIYLENKLQAWFLFLPYGQELPQHSSIHSNGIIYYKQTNKAY